MSSQWDWIIFIMIPDIDSNYSHKSAKEKLNH